MGQGESTAATAAAGKTIEEAMANLELAIRCRDESDKARVVWMPTSCGRQKIVVVAVEGKQHRVRCYRHTGNNLYYLEVHL